MAIFILTFSTKLPKIKYKKNSYLRRLLTDFQNFFFCFFPKFKLDIDKWEPKTFYTLRNFVWTGYSGKAPMQMSISV